MISYSKITSKVIIIKLFNATSRYFKNKKTKKRKKDKEKNKKQKKE